MNSEHTAFTAFKHWNRRDFWKSYIENAPRTWTFFLSNSEYRNLTTFEICGFVKIHNSLPKDGAYTVEFEITEMALARLQFDYQL